MSAVPHEADTAAARADVDVMPNLLRRARVHATEGEIVGALREVFGTDAELPVFQLSRRRGVVRKLLIVALVGAVFALLAAQALASTRAIKVGDNYFVRPSGVPTVTVRKGTTVVWRFAGANAHTVAVKSGPVKFESGARSSGTFRKTLTRTGTYLIYCTLHGAKDQSMRLKVR